MWDQPLIIGEYGSGKATLAMKAALSYLRKGRAVFPNALASLAGGSTTRRWTRPSAACPSMRSC